MSTSKSLRVILEEMPEAPSLSTVTKWLSSNDDFQDAYTRAKAIKADFLAGEVMDIVDNDKLQAHDKRIRFEGRKWLASKYAPKIFGDSLDVTSKGEALAAPVLNQTVIDQRVQTLLLLAQQRREASDLLE